MVSPYDSLPGNAFWRTGVQGSDPAHPDGIYQPKFEIGRHDRITTAGSCFAQHIARHLRQAGYAVNDLEPAPDGMSDADARRFGYGLYSARYGNIYTVRQLLQLVEAAAGRFTPQDAAWEKDGRFYDALRPSVEPEGVESAEEVEALRGQHLDRVRRLIRTTDVFIFTLGLTEAWIHRDSGTVYPTAPGTIAGTYDPAVYELKIFSVTDMVRDMKAVLGRLQRHNPGLRVILTVSPVPLTATASGSHVLRATLHAKAVLRVVAETLCAEFDYVDYFPAFDIIMNPAARMGFFDDNLRSVSEAGVTSVMEVFRRAFGAAEHITAPVAGAPAPDMEAEVEIEEGPLCEDLLLEAFAPR